MIFIRPVNTRDLHFYSQKNRARTKARTDMFKIWRASALPAQALVSAGGGDGGTNA